MPRYEFFGAEVYIPDLDEIVSAVVKPLEKYISNNISKVLKNVSQLGSNFQNMLLVAQNQLSELFLNIQKNIQNAILQLDVNLSKMYQNLNFRFESLQRNLNAIMQVLPGAFAQAANIINQAIVPVGTLLSNSILAIPQVLVQIPDFLYNRISGSINPQEFLRQVQSYLKDLEKALTEALTPHSSKSPEQAAKDAQNLMIVGNIAYGALAVAKILAELLSAGQLDVTLNSVDEIPILQAYRSAIEEITRTSLEASLLEPLRYYYYKQHTPKIPSASDLIQFVVKECFPLEKLPEAPKEFVQYMQYQGFRSEWAKAYWEAHWRLPSPERIYEAFHRGILSEEEVKKYIVWHDYKPEPRAGVKISDVDLMLELTYRLPTRTEIRMMYEQGLASDEEVKEVVKAEGIHPKYIDKFVQWVKSFMVRDEMRSIERESRRLFAKGVIDENAYKDALRFAKIPEEFWPIFMKLAEIERIKYSKESKESERTLTYGKISQAYQYDIISDDEFIKMVQELGYDAETAKFLLSVEKRRKLDKMYDDYVDRLEFLYLNDYISEQDLRQEYKDLGYSEEEANVRIETLNLKKLPKRRYLTPTQVAKAFWRGLLSAEETRDYLMRLGYRGKDIEVLIMLYKPKSKAEQESMPEVE